MSHDERSFDDTYGARIHFYVWPVERPKAIVQLVHGVGEHALRYKHVAAALNAAGYTVYADDHRGHGQTGYEQHGGDLRHMGKLGPGGHRAAVAAVRQLTGIIRDENPGVPVVLLGHSWGSFIAQIILNTRPEEYAAVVLTGTAYRMPGSMDSGDLNRHHAHLGTTGAEWLSRDPAVADAFVADPYTTLEPLQKLFGLREAARIVGRPAKSLPDLPLLIQVGGDDPLGGERSALKLVDAYRRRSGLTDIELIVYEGARHEVFNETNRAEVIADTIAWLDDRVASPSA